jgi:hypothetical protein
MATSQKRSTRSMPVQAPSGHGQPAWRDARSIVLNTDALIPFEKASDLESAWLRARKWTRLTNLAVTGLLLDYEGCTLETKDLRLLQEVATAADTFADDFDRLRKVAPTQPASVVAKKSVA